MAIKGINEVIAEIKKLGKQAIQDIEDETEASAKQIELDAKNTVNTNASDLGKLGQSIISYKQDDLNWVIEARTTVAPYAPYIEFGTGGLVEVPAELQEMAIQFKGKGIKQVNLLPRPYLYPALLKGRKDYLKRLKIIVKKYSK